MIRDIYIAARTGAENEFPEPPTVELNVSVVGGNVHLARVELDDAGNRLRTDPPLVVSARTLLLALRAATDDDSLPNEAAVR
jgi:hypothetical protein